MPKKKNRCYAARYGGRYRNFTVPGKKTSETWLAYHDRLSALAAIAREQGARSAATALEKRAGAIAAKYKSVRTKARVGKHAGPGTYPWSECVKEARARGATDPKAVCGMIRARSRKRYPAYWRARTTRNPRGLGAKQHLDAALGFVADALQAPTKRKQLEDLAAAAVFSGMALGAARTETMKREANSVAMHVEKLIVEYGSRSGGTKRARRGKVGGKRPVKTNRKRPVKARNTASLKRSFMSLR